MSQVVGVHGIAQEQLGPKQLQAKWTPALQDGLLQAGADGSEPLQFEVAFYGDVFLAATAQGRQLKAALTTTVEPSSEDMPFLEEAMEELAQQLPEGAEDKGFGRLPTWAQPLAARLARKLDAAAVLLVSQELTQVRRYLEDDALAERVHSRVEAAIGHDCRTLIGHSLGSVVAHEVLALREGEPVDTLLTLGSPLSMRTVSKRLRSQGSGVPGRAARWVNVFDPRDPVACAGPLSRIREGVEDHEVDNGKASHAGERYLGKRACGQAVLDALA